MAYHEKMITKVKDIVEYYENNLSELDLNIDLCDLEIRCWRCGEIRRLQRCHIIPASAGGSDTPDNYMLLCNACHEEAPNIAPKERMFEWLHNTKSNLYNSFWSKKIEHEYFKTYNKSMYSEILTRCKINDNKFKEILIQNIDTCKTHIGHGRLNVATWVAFWHNVFQMFDE